MEKSAQTIDDKGVAVLHCAQRVRKRMKKGLDKDKTVEELKTAGRSERALSGVAEDFGRGLAWTLRGSA